MNAYYIAFTEVEGSKKVFLVAARSSNDASEKVKETVSSEYIVVATLGEFLRRADKDVIIELALEEKEEDEQA